jgi:hypothetical protein
MNGSLGVFCPDKIPRVILDKKMGEVQPYGVRAEELRGGGV